MSELAPNAQLYDTASNTWVLTFVASLTTPRASHTATLLATGAVLVSGGQSATSEYFASAEIYDPTAASFSAVTSMITARESHSATLSANGTVLIAGGQDAGGPLALAEIYDPVTKLWSPAASMNHARANHTAGGASSKECELYW